MFPEPAFQLEKNKKEAQKLKEQGLWVAAGAKFSKAMTLVDGKTDTRIKAELYHGRGELYMKLGNITDALNDAKECEKIDKKWIKVRRHVNESVMSCTSQPVVPQM